MSEKETMPKDAKPRQASRPDPRRMVLQMISAYLTATGGRPPTRGVSMPAPPRVPARGTVFPPGGGTPAPSPRPNVPFPSLARAPGPARLTAMEAIARFLESARRRG